MATRQHGGSSVGASDGLTVIGEGIHVNGRIHGEEDLRIEGRVEGAITLTETVHVAASGVVVATVEARDVVVSGVVVGNVSASNSVSLEPGAKLVGDINAPRVIIADGAAFKGNVTMGEASEDTGRTRTTSRSTPTSSASRARSTSSSSRSTSGSSKKPAKKAPAKKAAPRAVPRVAAIRPPGQDPSEVTVVVRHSAIADDESGEQAAPKATKKKTKKAPPRGRVPKPGKRGVNRR